MTVRCLSALQVAPQSWRNGGGRTHELLAWPAPRDWTLRISVADIESDGPFSAFPGVTRWFAVVAGAGVSLAFGAAQRTLHVGDAPFRFDGEQAPACRLLAGATRDLNLMFRDGHGAMRQVRDGIDWTESFAMRGLFTRVAGRWSGDGESILVAPLTLLWKDATPADGSAWRFVADVSEDSAPAAVADTADAADADGTVCGWWLGYTPQGSRP